MAEPIYDCLIVGGGPAGSSAALVLGRCRRSVLLIDAARPRNARETEIRGFIGQEGRARLLRAGISVDPRPLRAIEPHGDASGVRILFGDGGEAVRSGLFVRLPGVQASPLVERLGCDLTGRRTADMGPYERTNVPGLYVAGDASRRVQFAIVAAAEGAMTAFAVNSELLEEDEARRGRPR